MRVSNTALGCTHTLPSDLIAGLVAFPFLGVLGRLPLPFPLPPRLPELTLELDAMEVTGSTFAGVLVEEAIEE